jgi:hypothetical protein
MANAQTRSDLRARKRAGRKPKAIAAPMSLSPMAHRIRVHLWPRRGLTRAEEDALASRLDCLRADQHWNWAGTALIGDMWTDAELTEVDVVDHLCALQSDPELVRIDLSQPHPSNQRAVAWLRVRRNHPELRSLCALYRDRLLTVTSVIRALGGFVPDAADQAWPGGG